MARNLSSPLAVSEFDDDKPKKKSKQKRENRKAVRQLKKKTTTRTVKGLKVDSNKKRTVGSRSTTPSKSTSSTSKPTRTKKTKAPKEKKEKRTMFDKKVDRKIKRYKDQGYNTEGTRDAMERDSKSFQRKKERARVKKAAAKKKAEFKAMSPEDQKKATANSRYKRREEIKKKLGITGKSQSQIDKKKERKSKRSNKDRGEGSMCGNKPGKCKI